MSTTTNTAQLPDALIYEMVDGKPIPYRGFQSVLRGEKTNEDIMGSSYLQAVIITELLLLLGRKLDQDIYQLMTNEVGLQFAPKSWRAVDLAVYRKEALQGIPLDNHYLSIAPELVIEVDTKAALDVIDNPLGYYQTKTDHLLDFGVRKVVWIFTETRKILLAEANRPWTMLDWSEEIELFDNIRVNVADLTIPKE